MKNDIFEKDDYYVMILRRRKGVDFETKIDKRGLDKLKDFPYSWYANYNKPTDSYYVKSTTYQGIVDGKAKYKIVYLHRFLMEIEEYEDVDHINHDTLDNRYINLRLLSRSKNSKHRKGKNKNNSTGYRNVSYDKQSGLYMVQLQIDGKNTLIGKYTNLEEAAKVAEIERSKIYIIN